MSDSIEEKVLNLYIAGGTLQSNAACYVVRQADESLLAGLQEGHFCYVLTSRQMGKSSLMVRTTRTLREKGVHVAVVDLTAVGLNLTPEQWYSGLLSLIGQQFRLEDEVDDYWLDNAKTPCMLRFFEALREVVLAKLNGPVVLFVDEVDAVRSLSFSADEFFAGIRECYNRRAVDPTFGRLTFGLFGVATPADLIRDTRTTPFNIGKRIELTDFLANEVSPLAAGLGENGPELLNRILYWTNGHPYLTLKFCRTIAERGTLQTAADVDHLCEELFLSPRAREQDDNLLFVRERLLRSEEDTVRLITLYGQVRNSRLLQNYDMTRAGMIRSLMKSRASRASLRELLRQLRDTVDVPYDETNPLVSLLRLSGVTRLHRGCLLVRNRIYFQVFDEKWVSENMPGAELRRQKAAYRRGLMRATVFFVISLTLLGGLGLIILFQQFRLAQTNAIDLSRPQKILDSARSTVDAGPKIIPFDLPWYADSPERHYIGKVTHILGHNENVQTIAFDSDSKRLACVTESGQIVLWNIAADKVSSFPCGKRQGNAVLAFFAADGKRLIVLSWNRIEEWEMATGKRARDEALFGSGQFAQTLYRNNKGDRLAALLGNGNLALFSLPEGRKISLLKQGVQALYAFSPRGDYIAFRHDNADFVMSVAGRREVRLAGRPSGIFFTNNGKQMIGKRGQAINRLRIWDTQTGQFASKNALFLQNSILAFALSPDGKTVAVAGNYGELYFCDSATLHRQELLLQHQGPVHTAVFSPDGKWLASVADDKTVRLWKLPIEKIDLLTVWKSMGGKIDKDKHVDIVPWQDWAKSDKRKSK